MNIDKAKVLVKLSAEDLLILGFTGYNKHYAKLKAFAEGGKIEHWSESGWMLNNDPEFYIEDFYRVKPMTYDEAFDWAMERIEPYSAYDMESTYMLFFDKGIEFQKSLVEGTSK